MNIKRRLQFHFFDKASVRAVRNGLIMILPVMLVGSFVTLFRSLPIPAYREFLQSFGGGILSTLMTWLHQGTFGVMSLYMTVTISYCYIQELEKDSGHWMEAMVSSLAFFAILSGILSEGFNMERIGAAGMFTAIVSSLLATKLYYLFERLIGTKFRFYADGTDLNFGNAWSALFPFILVALAALLLNALIVYACKVNSLQDVFEKFCGLLFDNMKNNNSFGGGLLYVLLSTLLWFLGIHGENALYTMMADVIIPATKMNMEAVSVGEVPTQILTNNFFDYFVYLGGCGSCLCLLLAILLFSKRKGNRRLAITAFPTVIFNISELVVFGLPVVFNPIMFVPFLLVPVVNYCISYLVFMTGMLPAISTYTSWTMPLFFSGYLSTGSKVGILLQIVNLCIGVLIYYPFIKILDRQRQKQAVEDIDYLIRALKESEACFKPVNLLYLPGSAGILAKALANDLRHALQKKEIKMYYQPQFDSTGQCIGAEALLRWQHPVFGMIYPPLAIKLAEEAKILYELEKYVFVSVAESLGTIQEKLGKNKTVCVNVSNSTLVRPEFRGFLKELTEKYQIDKGSICIEINEQTTLSMDDETVDLFAYFKELGFLNAVDDFSMGHTSLKCLRTGQFDIVKLDGELVKDILISRRNQNIIESIMHLSKTMGFDVLAEYVETEEQQKELEGIGCIKYQGYLYSAAVPLETFLQKAVELK